MNWLNRFIRGMAFRDGEISAYNLELGALLIIIGVLSLLIGLLVLREGGKDYIYGQQPAKTDLLPSNS